MKVITIANQKGGVGKTTTAVHLAHFLAREGRTVLLIDLDPQGQAASALGLRPEPGAFYLLTMPQAGYSAIAPWLRSTVRPDERVSGRERLFLLPGDTTTATAQIVYQAENRPIYAIREALQVFREDTDVVVIDTAPSAGGIQERAVFAADFVIVPTAVDYLSLEGVSKMMTTLAVLNGQGWHGALLGVLPTFYDERTRESSRNLDILQKHFGDQVLKPIHRSVRLREAAAEGLTVFEYAPKSRAAEEYRALGRVVMEHL